MTVATEPKRYANGIARREQILDSATELFAADGYRAVSLRDVAKHAGISHPGLLRYVASRDELLLAILDRLEQNNADWIDSFDWKSPVDIVSIVELARRNATVPGYVELYTTLAGQATNPDHPAHQHFKTHYELVRDATSGQFSSARTAGAMPPDYDAGAEATRFAAAWDGLQIQSLYAPSTVDVEDHLRRHAQRLAGVTGGASEAPRALLQEFPEPWPETDCSGYATGRERRARIVADAAELFAMEGYSGTSLREIAEQVGISKSTLLHHFASKEDLLTAVLIHRDKRIVPATSVPGESLRDWLLSTADGARSDERTPGLIKLYTVLSCEASAPNHPAHGYFANRFELGRNQFTAALQALQARGELTPGIDPAHEAVWLIALWDGLQIQWLYDPKAVDVAELLHGYLVQLMA